MQYNSLLTIVLTAICQKHMMNSNTAALSYCWFTLENAGVTVTQNFSIRQLRVS